MDDSHLREAASLKRERAEEEGEDDAREEAEAEEEVRTAPEAAAEEEEAAAEEEEFFPWDFFEAERNTRRLSQRVAESTWDGVNAYFGAPVDLEAVIRADRRNGQRDWVLKRKDEAGDRDVFVYCSEGPPNVDYARAWELASSLWPVECADARSSGHVSVEFNKNKTVQSAQLFDFLSIARAVILPLLEAGYRVLSAFMKVQNDGNVAPMHQDKYTGVQAFNRDQLELLQGGPNALRLLWDVGSYATQGGRRAFSFGLGGSKTERIFHTTHARVIAMNANAAGSHWRTNVFHGRFGGGITFTADLVRPSWTQPSMVDTERMATLVGHGWMRYLFHPFLHRQAVGLFERVASVPLAPLDNIGAIVPGWECLVCRTLAKFHLIAKGNHGGSHHAYFCNGKDWRRVWMRKIAHLETSEVFEVIGPCGRDMLPIPDNAALRLEFDVADCGVGDIIWGWKCSCGYSHGLAGTVWSHASKVCLAGTLERAWLRVLEMPNTVRRSHMNNRNFEVVENGPLCAEELTMFRPLASSHNNSNGIDDDDVAFNWVEILENSRETFEPPGRELQVGDVFLGWACAQPGCQSVLHLRRDYFRRLHNECEAGIRRAWLRIVALRLNTVAFEEVDVAHAPLGVPLRMEQGADAQLGDIVFGWICGCGHKTGYQSSLTNHHSKQACKGKAKRAFLRIANLKLRFDSADFEEIAEEAVPCLTSDLASKVDVRTPQLIKMSVRQNDGAWRSLALINLFPWRDDELKEGGFSLGWVCDPCSTAHHALHYYYTNDHTDHCAAERDALRRTWLRCDGLDVPHKKVIWTEVTEAQKIELHRGVVRAEFSGAQKDIKLATYWGWACDACKGLFLLESTLKTHYHRKDCDKTKARRAWVRISKVAKVLKQDYLREVKEGPDASEVPLPPPVTKEQMEQVVKKGRGASKKSRKRK